MSKRKEREQIAHLTKICHQGKHDQIEEYLSDFPHFLNVRDTTDMAMTAPLHVCCSRGYYHCVKLLLVLNADVDVVDMKGRTPFHLSCMTNHFKIAKLLKTKGGSVTKQDYLGHTALHLVLQSPTTFTYDNVKWLVDAGSDPFVVDNFGVSPYSIIQKQHESKPTASTASMLECVEKLLPVYVSEEQIDEDHAIFSMGLGLALGLVLKKERMKQKQRAAHKERKKQRALEKIEKDRARPEMVRKMMFEHMALMKTRKDFRLKQMKYVFPDESDLSSLPVALSVADPETPEAAATKEKKYDDNGRKITKYT